MAFYIQDMQLIMLNNSYRYLLTQLFIISQTNSVVKNSIFNKKNIGRFISKVFYIVACENRMDIKTIKDLSLVR